MSKFDGKFRKNKDYQEDNEIASNFVKIKKRCFEEGETRRPKSKQPGHNHRKQPVYESYDG